MQDRHTSVQQLQDLNNDTRKTGKYYTLGRTGQHILVNNAKLILSRGCYHSLVGASMRSPLFGRCDHDMLKDNSFYTRGN